MDDDHDLRESLVTLLRAMRRPVMAFDSGKAFHDFYDGSLPGCLILDIQMPGRSGLELYGDLMNEGKRLPVIFITAHANVSTAVAAMKTGAMEFLEKPFDIQTLSRHIDAAFELDRNWRTNEQRYHELNGLVGQLNRTDHETLTLILQGETNRAMSLKLHITERAVELRRQRLMQRLGVRSLAELLDLTITHRVMEEFRGITGAWRATR